MNTSIKENLPFGEDCLAELELPQWAALLGGGALAVLGLTLGLKRRSAAGFALAAAGGALAYAGTKPRSTTSQEYEAQGSVQINRSPEELYRFWRNFENLPRFMRHLESVEREGNGQSKWTAAGPLGTPVTWTAEIVGEHENSSIAWRSLPGSLVMVDGLVEFRPAPGNRGTFVVVTMRYTPPGGALGNAAAKIFGKDPRFLVRQDLKRFKALMETGEIPTTDGQSHGPRSAKAEFFHKIDPDAAPTPTETSADLGNRPAVFETHEPARGHEVARHVYDPSNARFEAVSAGGNPEGVDVVGDDETRRAS